MRRRRGTSLVVQVTLAFLLGVLLVTVGADRTTSSAEFAGTPRFVVWTVIIAVQTATWPLVWRIGCDRLAQVRAYVPSGGGARDLVRVGALVCVVGLFWLLPQLGGERADTGLWGHPYRMGLLTLGALAVAVPSLLTMWRIFDALGATGGQATPASATPASAIDRLVALRTAFSGALAAVGVLVTEATLASGALRNALIAWQPGRAEDFPAEFVLLYGSFFTALLAAAALPTYARLHRAADTFIEDTLPLLPPTSADDEWQRRLGQRRDLAAMVHLSGSASQTMQSAVVVAGPLLSGLIALLVPARS